MCASSARKTVCKVTSGTSYSRVGDLQALLIQS